MKFYKYLVFAVLATISLTACEDNNYEDYPNFLGEVNSASGVTVDLDPTFSFNENQSMVYVPVNVHGTANGKVVVTVEVKEEGANPAKLEKDFNVTSRTINIPAGESVGYVEVTPVWEQGVINDDTNFSITITKVEGATVSGNATCLCTIVNVDDAYTMMAGSWTFTAIDRTTGQEISQVLTMKTLDADDQYYGTELDAFGLKGYNYVYIPFGFEFDMASQQMNLTLMASSFATTSLINFTGLGQCVVVSSTDYPNSLGQDVPLEVVDYNEIIFPENASLTLAVMPYPALNEIFGHWGSWTKMHMTRN